LKLDFYFLRFLESDKLFEILESAGIEGRFVGGCVRDSILGLETDDLDLAVNRDILTVKRILEENGVKCIETGLKYGSITSVINGRHFEITSLRTDDKCFGRACEVSGTSSFEEDSKRRDFTMNAMYVSRDGEVFDYCGGLADLRDRHVRFIGNPHDRIREDYLRIFRYYRFCGRFGDLRDEYSNIISSEAHNVKSISIERIQKELFGILQSKYAIEMLKFMSKSGILREIFKKIDIKRLQSVLDMGNGLCPLELKLYVLFDFEDLIKTLRLTKMQKAIIKDYKNFENESLQYCLYKKGKEFAENVALIKSIAPHTVQFVADAPKFPVSFQDLPLGTANASKKLRDCEKWWVEGGSTKSKDECLAYINLL
jgi:poly(A) polymerase